MRITLKDFIRIKACFHLEDSSGVCSCLPAMTHLVRYRQLEAQNGGALNHCKHRQQRKAMCEAAKVIKNKCILSTILVLITAMQMVD